MQSEYENRLSNICCDIFAEKYKYILDEIRKSTNGQFLLVSLDPELLKIFVTYLQAKVFGANKSVEIEKYDKYFVQHKTYFCNLDDKKIVYMQKILYFYLEKSTESRFIMYTSDLSALDSMEKRVRSRFCGKIINVKPLSVLECLSLYNNLAFDSFKGVLESKVDFSLFSNFHILQTQKRQLEGIFQNKSMTTPSDIILKRLAEMAINSIEGLKGYLKSHELKSSNNDISDTGCLKNETKNKELELGNDKVGYTVSSKDHIKNDESNPSNGGIESFGSSVKNQTMIESRDNMHAFIDEKNIYNDSEKAITAAQASKRKRKKVRKLVYTPKRSKKNRNPIKISDDTKNLCALQQKINIDENTKNTEPNNKPDRKMIGAMSSEYLNLETIKDLYTALYLLQNFAKNVNKYINYLLDLEDTRISIILKYLTKLLSEPQDFNFHDILKNMTPVHLILLLISNKKNLSNLNCVTEFQRITSNSDEIKRVPVQIIRTAFYDCKEYGLIKKGIYTYDKISLYNYILNEGPIFLKDLLNKCRKVFQI